MSLDRRHFDSDTWRLLRAEIERRIATCRAANDRPQNTEQQTATLRGRILELKDLLALEKAPAHDAGPDKAPAPDQRL